MITITDVIRSLLIGQSIILVLFVAANAVITIAQQKPRPGRTAGFIMVSFSYILCVLLLDYWLWERFGQRIGVVTIVGSIALISGTLGFTFLVLSALFHIESVVEFLRKKHWL